MKNGIFTVLVTVLYFLVLAGCARVPVDAYSGMPRPGGVRGTLTGEDGMPMAGGVVYFYESRDKGFKGPADFMAEPADEAGRYITELPPGTYWAVARMRVSGSVTGNLQQGDYHTQSAVGPVEVSEGGYAELDMELVSLSGNMLFNVFAGRGDLQGVRGTITSRDGSPAERAYAFAYRDGRMAGKPDYVSEWTREDGRYVIYVHEPGIYYIGARTGYRGVPRSDEPYGRYDGAPDHSVEVPGGVFVDGVDVKLTPFSSGM